MLRLNLDNGWTFKRVGSDKEYPASVPGDVTVDHFNNALIADPYVKMNYMDSFWLLREDFEYRITFNLTNEFVDYDKIYVNLQGVDTYSDVYVNGQHVGYTENMFVGYRFDAKKFVIAGKNEVRIVLHSTLNKMDTFDCKDYFATFNVPRLFVRKAQCHFGWDWAPNLPGYGIWQEVFLTAEPETVIDTVNYWPRTNGQVTFFADLNYNVRLKPYTDYAATDTLKFMVAKEPNKPLDESNCCRKRIA